MSDPAFVHLRLHSEYSIADGTVRIDEAIDAAAQDAALSHFDYVLNAALLLAYVGVRQGDSVGFMTMSGEERWFAPRKSAATVSAILNRVYDLRPTLHRQLRAAGRPARQLAPPPNQTRLRPRRRPRARPRFRRRQLG